MRSSKMRGNKADRNHPEDLKTISIGLVGYGSIGALHTANWRNLHLYFEDLPAKIRLHGVTTNHQETASRAVHEGGFEMGTTDYRVLIENPDIDLIDISTPNDLHYPIFMEALEAGKHIYCEKPLALNLTQAEEMLRRAEDSDRAVQIVYNYRFIPAVMRAKQLIEEGFLGEVLSFGARYFHSSYLDPKRPLSWRLSQSRSGGGALVDLGSHAIDLMLTLCGPFHRLIANTRTFIPERPTFKGSQENKPISVDDHAQLLVELSSGGVGTIEVSRLAAGTTDDLAFKIYGTRGAIRFDIMDPNGLYVFDARQDKKPLGGKQGFTKIQTLHRYPGNKLPGSRSMVNAMSMHAYCQAQMIQAVLGRKEAQPSVRDAYNVQKVLEASYRSSEENTWVTLDI